MNKYLITFATTSLNAACVQLAITADSFEINGGWMMFTGKVKNKIVTLYAFRLGDVKSVMHEGLNEGLNEGTPTPCPNAKPWPSFGETNSTVVDK